MGRTGVVDESETCSQQLTENVLSKIEEIYFPKNEFLKDDRNFIDLKKKKLLEENGKKYQLML